MQNRSLPLVILGVAAFMASMVGLVFILFSSSIFFTLGPTEKAVIFYPYSKGLDKETVLHHGSHMKAPWTEKIVYDVSEHTLDETMDVVDKNGLYLQVIITIRSTPQPDKIGYLHQSFYGEYKERFVIPEARSIIRQIMAQYQAEEIYSTKRTEIEVAINEEVRKKFDTNFLILNGILIRSIKLPNQTR